jgi:hypothetical protein
MKTSTSFKDPIVEEVHHTRAKLLEKYGGPDGYAEHLRRLESELTNRVVTRQPRPPVKTVRKAS